MSEIPDELDRLLADFFKSEMKRPWPAAPVPQLAEPSELAARAAAPRNQPAPARPDATARARVTLAASVALLLGTAFYMADGYAPAVRPAPLPGAPAPRLLPGSDAKGPPGGVLDTLHKDKGNGNGGPVKIDPGRFE